ncbi:unnamed protein product [Cylindrotheca closterium]|uniref:VTT domain-containing protein n=1 Tax=Cylindrotheca closterium TaxID=2856 RepID=A0AAD2JLZ5_9STRA|nr:unnamed protein product [Cylindrotheca closterium]
MIKPGDTEESSASSSAILVESSSSSSSMEELSSSSSASPISSSLDQQSPNNNNNNNNNNNTSAMDNNASALPAQTEGRQAPKEESLLERLRAKNREWHKKGLCMFLLIVVVVLLILDSTKFCIIPMLLSDFLEWVEQNPIPGIFAFMIVFLVATVLLIPGAILTLGAGYVFANAFGISKGVLLGSISSFLGAVAGSLVSFLLGRYFLSGWVSRMSTKYDTFQALTTAMEEKGLRIMILLRLSPALPYNILNYLSAVTGISIMEYTVSLLALLPGTVLYVFLGASAGSLASTNESGNGSTTTTIVIVTSIVFGIAAIGLTSYYAKRELNKITERKRRIQALSVTEVLSPEDLNSSSSGFETAPAMEEGEGEHEEGEEESLETI